jgi:hypothetical protein
VFVSTIMRLEHSKVYTASNVRTFGEFLIRNDLERFECCVVVIIRFNFIVSFGKAVWSHRIPVSAGRSHNSFRFLKNYEGTL